LPWQQKTAAQAAAKTVSKTGDGIRMRTVSPFPGHGPMDDEMVERFLEPSP
jgi:hypothetical protein